MIKLLLVDDHQLVRMGMKRLLEEVASFKIVGEASTGEEAVVISRQLSRSVDGYYNAWYWWLRSDTKITTL